MTFFLHHPRTLGGLFLVLLLVCSALFWYGQEAVKTHERLLLEIRHLSTQKQAALQEAAFFTQKKALLTHMKKQGFVCKEPATYPQIKDLILHEAKACHLDKIRLESAPSKRSNALHHRPVTLYFQAVLDTDLYTFVRRLEARLPGAMRWTFFSLFQTPDGRLQGEAHADLINHAP